MPLRMVDSYDDAKEPGDCFYMIYGKKCPFWQDCPACKSSGHLFVKLPNRLSWDSDARASNCNRQDDHKHRCWVKSGDIEHLTVGKDGNTCSAGAGSIAMDGGGGVRNWHGFIRNGEFVTS